MAMTVTEGSQKLFSIRLAVWVYMHMDACRVCLGVWKGCLGSVMKKYQSKSATGEQQPAAHLALEVHNWLVKNNSSEGYSHEMRISNSIKIAKVPVLDHDFR